MSILSAYMLPHPPLIVPEIGKGQERAISHTTEACHEAARRIGDLRPDTIILISPHQTMYSDYFHISPGKRLLFPVPGRQCKDGSFLRYCFRPKTV